LKKIRNTTDALLTLHIQGVSGGIVNILGGSSMDYSEFVPNRPSYFKIKLIALYTGCFRRNSKYFRR